MFSAEELTPCVASQLGLEHSPVMLLLRFFLAAAAVAAGRARNSLARTPPMGWMSWEIYRCDVNCSANRDNCISEWLYRTQTDALVEGGYRDAGYTGIHVDDCWMQRKPPRDASTGELVCNRDRFPSGMQALADYMHQKGVKFGHYTAESPQTCAGYPASGDNEDLDANTFAKWGVDYLKVDGCGDTKYYETGYRRMGAALEASGRRIEYSCSWPAYIGDDETTKPFATFIMDGCNLWRNWADIDCNWGSLSSIIDHWGDYGLAMAPFAGPGHWHDMDMLLIGANCLTTDEERTQMAIWSISASPLIMGNNLSNVSASSRAILLNKRAIAVNQDLLGQMGVRLSAFNTTSPQQIWARNLLSGDVAVALYNKLGASPPSASPSGALCPSWHEIKEGVIEACGGGAGDFLAATSSNNAGAGNMSLAQAMDVCCAAPACEGFSLRPREGGRVAYHAATAQRCGRPDVDRRVAANRDPQTADITVRFADLNLFGKVAVYDMWSSEPESDGLLGIYEGSYTALGVQLHGTAFLLLSPEAAAGAPRALVI